jgi:hypothetical protein
MPMASKLNRRRSTRMMDGNENLLDNDLTRNYDLQNPSTQNQQPLLWQMWPQEECPTNGAEFVPTMFGPQGGAGAFDHPYNLSNEHGAGMDN